MLVLIRYENTVTILKPTSRILAMMYHGREPGKIWWVGPLTNSTWDICPQYQEDDCVPCFHVMQPPAVRHARADVDSVKRPCWQQSSGVWDLCRTCTGRRHGTNGRWVCFQKVCAAGRVWKIIVSPCRLNKTFSSALYLINISVLLMQATAQWFKCTQEGGLFGRVWRALASLLIFTKCCMSFPSATSMLC